MLFKVIENEEMAQVEELWNYCFEKREEPFFKYYFNEYCGFRNTVIGGFEKFDEELCLQTMLHLNPYTLRMRGREEIVPYIVGVATAPEARGQHLFAGLAKTSFRVLRKQGMDFVTLMPIYAGIYLPYEFSFCYFKKKYIWETGKLTLPRMKLESKKLALVHMELANPAAVSAYTGEEPGEAKTKLYNEEVQPLFAYLYEELTAAYNGVPKRTDFQWEKLLSVHALEGTQAVLVHKDGEPQGYMFYSINNGTFRILELLAKNSSAEQRLLHYANMHINEASKVEWLAEPWNKAYIYFADAGQAPQLVPFMMARCLNPESALKKLQPQMNFTGELVVQLLDNVLEENNQLLHISGGAEGLHVETTAVKPNIIMDTAAFTQMYLGALSAAELYEAGQIRCLQEDKLVVLDQLLPKCRNWINEYF